jgi:DNA-binding SARP family transcriptional activator
VTGRTSVADIVLNLLGPPSVAFPTAHDSVPQLSGKALALLTYLVLEPGAHTREKLAGLLWGESTDNEARASLRQALKHLRCHFGGDLRCDRSVVELTGNIECPIRDFRSQVAQEPRLGLELDVSRFLSGFSVRHAPQFDEWVTEFRRRLLRQYQEALGRMARDAMGQWHWRDAMDLADRWLSTDPLSDEAIRLAIEARYLSGDRGAALARYQEYRALLLHETGCEPSRTLLNLVHRVESDPAPASKRPITDEWYARAPSFQTSLIGREKEWAALEKSWKAVRRGLGRIILIEGEPGVGKSRLADDFLRWVVAQGGSVLRGHGYDVRAGLPYEPVVEILRDALSTPGLGGAAPEWLTEATKLLPELRQRFANLPEAAPTTDVSSGWRLFESIAQILLALAAEQPIAVSLDDLQWCDDDSCNLIRFLIRRTEQSPILWLGTFTLGEVERDAPAARLCRVLRAKSHATVLALATLGEDELWQMIREMGHVSTPTGARRFANRLHAVTAGNPFYLVELLKTMFAQGLLAVDPESGEWTVSQEGMSEQGREFPLSQSVHDVIAERVERLPGELRDVLITIALSGTGCRAEVLSHVHGISRLHAASVGDTLVDRRLVVEEGGAYRCAHPVIAHVVRDGLTVSRRRELHRTIAMALERTISPKHGIREVAREIAQHADRGGEPVLAYRFALVAGQAAIERYAFAEALSWLDLAAGNAQGEEEADAANQLTANVLEAAGWTEAPRLQVDLALTRELQKEDLDLPVRK